MHRVNYVEEELPLSSPGKSKKFLLRTPADGSPPLSQDPALLINLSMDRRHALDMHPYCITSDLFLSAGHRVASFDLPSHGENADELGDGLVGIAATIAAGVDAFEIVRASARHVVSHAIDNGLVRAAGRVFISGTSRGGLSALHAMVAEPRIAAGALYAPVTDLEVLEEFASLAASPLLQRSNARALVGRLAGRSIYTCIGLTDARVGTANCLEFHARLQRVLAGGPGCAKLHVDSSEAHRVSDAAHVLGATFLLEQAARRAGVPASA